MWKAQFTIDGEHWTSCLKNVQLFQNISQLMLYKLVYELTEVVIFRKDDVIFDDCSYTEEGHIKYIEMKRISHKKLQQ